MNAIAEIYRRTAARPERSRSEAAKLWAQKAHVGGIALHGLDDNAIIIFPILMERLPFEPPDADGNFFSLAAPADDTEIYYHGTSLYFSDTIEKRGFEPDFRFVTAPEFDVLMRYQQAFVITGTFYVRDLDKPKVITLTKVSRGALRYTNKDRKGGIALDLLHHATALLASNPHEIRPGDIAALETIKERLSPLDEVDGIIYAIRLGKEEVEQFEGWDPYYATHIPRERLVCSMTVPHDFTYPG